MSGSGTAVVKCEPPSDDEDDSPQLPDIFVNNTISSEFHPLSSIKVEVDCHNVEGMPTLLHHLQSAEGLEELSPLAPAGPAATPVCVKQEPAESPALTLETLEPAAHTTGSLLDRHMAILKSSEVPDSATFTPLRTVKDEPSSEGEQQPGSSDDLSDACAAPECFRAGHKGWTQRDMERALDALRNHHMSLTKASATYGIPSTTLWQRAHRLGIDTPKKEGGTKSWSECDLRGALRALRAGAISANKASKAYGIPSSTLYKIARREGIRLAAPFNAAPVAWRRGDLQRALAAIRAGRASVQRAASQYGIPTGTLYGRCKREGIELSRSNPTPWSEDAMGEALEAVRIGLMSINQAAIHYNLPYSSLYGRFKRCKYPTQQPHQELQNAPETVHNHQDMSYYHQMPMYSDAEPSVLHPYPYNEYVPSASVLDSATQEPYCDAPAPPTLYYHQNFSSIATNS